MRRVLAYGAGIGALGSGEVAPPPFCVSLEWPVASHPELAALLGAEPGELLRGVHATQDSVFYAPIRPGAKVRTTGRVTAMRATSAGTLLTCRYDSYDDQGRILVSSWSDSMYRGVGLDGEPRTREEPPPLPRLGEAGPPETIAIPIPREMPHVYTECARIWNPIHTERVVALAAGLPDIILHGTATWALAGREIVARHAGGEPRRLRRLRGRFRAMVIPGTTIELELTSAGGGLVAFRVRNADGEEAIQDGVAVLDPR